MKAPLRKSQKVKLVSNGHAQGVDVLRIRRSKPKETLCAARHWYTRREDVRVDMHDYLNQGTRVAAKS